MRHKSCTTTFLGETKGRDNVSEVKISLVSWEWKVAQGRIGQDATGLNGYVKLRLFGYPGSVAPLNSHQPRGINTKIFHIDLILILLVEIDPSCRNQRAFPFAVFIDIDLDVGEGIVS